MQRLMTILGCAAALGGCALDQSGARVQSVSANADFAMTADYRMIFKRSRDDRRVYCAEPSPDIARIVSAASSLNLTGSAKGLEKVQPELALAFASSRAEGLAQLGQRLATIQLLRDSTFRACEAYANGAIGPSTYAMIVSRYDDVMVTLLLGEMAAGSARHAPASLLSGVATTGGLSQATLEAATKLALTRMDKATSALDGAVAARSKLKADASDAEKSAAAQAVAAARKEFDEASSLLKASLSAVSGNSASTTKVVEGEDKVQYAASTVAQQLGSMQQRYLEDFNLDAVTVGCLSALSQFDWPEQSRITRQQQDAAPPKPERVAANGASANQQGTAAEQIPQSFGAQGAGGSSGFLSSTPGGAYSLQDECRAILLNGQTLRAVAKARLDQIARRSAGEQALGR
jgi:hypothetical protein